MLPSNDTARVALTQWTRSASQNNVDALVKVGDYYYHGFGVPDEPEAVRWEKAAGYYQSAADTQLSALAMWNLGWMYENGIGVTQVFNQAHARTRWSDDVIPGLPLGKAALRLSAGDQHGGILPSYTIAHKVAHPEVLAYDYPTRSQTRYVGETHRQVLSMLT